MFGSNKAAKKPNFTQRLLANIRKASPGVVLPLELSDTKIRNHFGEKLINVNLNALVHIQLATKILEYLVNRRVINFGEKVDKTDVANSIIKKNKAFIDKLTQNHQKGIINDFDQFTEDVQVRVEETTSKLMAILMTGDRRLGNQDSELAAPVIYPIKVAIALTVDDLMKLFGRDNPIREKCHSIANNKIDQDGMEGFDDFFDYMKAHIKQGNNTKAYTYLRIASASVFSLSRSGQGIDLVHQQVANSLVESGNPIDGNQMDFSDLPSFEEEFENLNALFNNEEMRLSIHGGAFACLAFAGLAYVRDCFEPTLDLQTKIDALFAVDTVTAAMSPAERDLAKSRAVRKGYEKLRRDLESIVRGFVDGADGRSPEERLGFMRPKIVKVAGLLSAFANSDKVRNKGPLRMERSQPIADGETSIEMIFMAEIQSIVNEIDRASKEFTENDAASVQKLNAGQQQQVRAFCARLSELLERIASEGYVTVSDIDIPPTANRVPFFPDFINAIATVKRGIRDAMMNKTLFDKEPEDGGPSPVSSFELAEKLVLFLNNASFHTIDKAK